MSLEQNSIEMYYVAYCKPVMFACALFHEFHGLGDFAKIAG